MNDDMMAIALAAAGFVTLTLYLSWRSKRKAAAEWAGTVAEVRRYEGEGEGASQIRVKLSWRRDDGGTDSIDMDAAAYDAHFAGLKRGDRLVKKPGEEMPVRA